MCWLRIFQDADWGAGNKDIILAAAAQYNITIEVIFCATGAANFTAQAAYFKQQKYNIFIPMLNQREAYLLFDAAKYETASIDC